MHGMRPIAVDVPVAWCGQSVCNVPAHGKTAARIEVLFGVETLGDPRNIVLDGGLQPRGEGEAVRYGLCQITLSSVCLCVIRKYLRN